MKEAIISQKDFLGQKSIEILRWHLLEFLTLLKSDFAVLMDLTGVDYLEPEPHTKVHYLLHNPKTYERLRIIVTCKRGESLASVTTLWEGADWYERELFDMFGVNFEGHPDLKRILMPDDWIGHPMRRDFALMEEPVEFKHGVLPKIPSEIIPNV
jgi:NADH-quinone oxidoreductase subunit C